MPEHLLRRPYRFGFILSTSLGNLTRYRILRKFAERDASIDFTWAPVKHYLAPGEPDHFRWLPGFLKARAIVLQQSWPCLQRFGEFDAVMIHMYEVDLLTSVRAAFLRSPLRVISTDDAPAIDPANYPLHPVDQAKPAWRRALRLRLDLWRARRADLLIPFSKWAAKILVEGAGIDNDKVIPLHVGLDLDVWKYVPKAPLKPGERAKLLFVGGEFQRKGGAHLLASFQRHLSDIAELHLVTKSGPTILPPHVYVYGNLSPNDERLAQLYREADIFIHPTTSDLTPWVVLEALASGCPTIVTRIGGIGELVEEGRTGLFVPVGDVDALGAAIRSLLADPARLHAIGQEARRFIEQNFDASVNVPKILGIMKSAVDRRRSEDNPR